MDNYTVSQGPSGRFVVTLDGRARGYAFKTEAAAQAYARQDAAVSIGFGADAARRILAKRYDADALEAQWADAHRVAAERRVKK